MKSFFLFGFFSSTVIAAIGEFTQQEALAWAGTIAAVISLLVMSLLPLYARIRDAILKADIADREARKEDCHEALRRQKELTNDLSRRIVVLERECQEWQRLYTAGSRDFPKMEGKNE
jgi:hypothetical protein